MQYSTNYNLKLPEGSDFYNVSDFDDNFTAIDAQMKTNADGIASGDSAITAEAARAAAAEAENATAIANETTRAQNAESSLSATITNGLAGKSDTSHTHTPAALGGGYGTCSTAAATAAKVATLSGYTLVTGGKPTIKFTYAVPASATLNINSQGAKSIYYNGSVITADIIAAGDIVTFVYTGSRYDVIAIDHCAKVTQTLQNSSDTVPSGSAVTAAMHGGWTTVHTW